MKPSAIGIFVKCGKAYAVLVSLAEGTVEVIDRRMILLADASLPDTTQPFHVFETRSGPAAQRLVDKLQKRVAQIAKKSIDDLLREYEKGGYEPDRAAVVTGSKADPGTIKNEHIRWHALEGQLFRKVVEEALLSNRLSCSILLSKEILKTGASVLDIKEEKLAQQLKEVGRSLKPWRSEDKAACLAAWLSLAGVSEGRNLPHAGKKW
jgi:hypothetical protein